jgi:hypothetical protein
VAVLRKYPEWARAEAVRLWTETGASVPQIRRALAAGVGDREPIEASSKAIEGWLIRPRSTGADVAGIGSGALAHTMNRRILVLLERELQRLEKSPKGTLDVERLDRIARTLATVEKSSPPPKVAREEKGSSLLRLAEGEHP